MREKKYVYLIVLLGIILKSISFYQYREALYLDNLVSIIIYIAIIFGDVILSRVKKFLIENVFQIVSLGCSLLLIISKFDIMFAYAQQCAMFAFCLAAILFGEKNKKYKNKLYKIIYFFFGIIIYITILFGIGGILLFSSINISLNYNKREEILFQKHIEKLKKELGE